MIKNILWRRISFFALIFFFALSKGAFAYNPPVMGQQLFNLGSPVSLTSTSCSGGGIFMPSSTSIAMNPALPAMEQRVRLDFGFTGLISTDSDDIRPFNAAFETGILVPTKYLVATGFVNGVFTDGDVVDIGNSINIRAGVSKVVSEHIAVGANIYGGGLWGVSGDWSLGADVGFMYKWTNLGALKDLRLGVSIMNLGKNYNMFNGHRTVSIKYGRNDSAPLRRDWEDSDEFPTILTVKAGISSTFLQLDAFKMGFSVDIGTPLFQDAIIDIGLQGCVKDFFYFSIAEKVDVMELKESVYDCIPAIGIGFKFKIKTHGKFFEQNDWGSSDLMVNAAWQQKYDYIQAVGIGASLFLGQLDTKGPTIKLWED